ncbi:MAG: nitronate monooxygenase [Cytophagaceae bacterium]|jgi:enoyl-[acyl-carrier protein] reductase II|nr:nitronate monooxygenase [Cytophagaceae bacterium]
MQNRITQLLGCTYPIIQAGMVWCSGWRLAAAVSEAGGLGVIGAGSMSPELLREHIQSYRKHCQKPFAVNLPLLYSQVEEHVKIVIEEKVPVVISSAGNPALYTGHLQAQGIRVMHVVSSAAFARKAAQCGVEAVIAEGVEAGGHNGKEETTTLCLLPLVCEAVQVPVIAAGGIASGKAMLAAFALGAEGVQIGSLFATAQESSAHPDFKAKILSATEGSTRLSLKKLNPVRLLQNEFARQVQELEAQGASAETLRALLGKGRARLGMFEGNLDDGELEIGQVAYMIRESKPAAQLVAEIWNEFLLTADKIKNIHA